MTTRRTIARAAAMTLAVLISAPLSALAGEPVDPNLGDDVLGRAGGIRYASETDTFDPGNSDFAMAEAGCGGPRWHVIGGGSESKGAASQGRHAVNRPLDFDDADGTLDDGWDASGYGASNAGFTGYSICIRDATLRYRNRSVGDAPTGNRTASIGCGGRWDVTAGGLFIATSQSWVSSSHPMDGDDRSSSPDDGWAGSVFDTVGGLGAFEIHAVCTDDQAIRYVQRAPVQLPRASAVTRRLRCRAGEHVVGGGARISGAPANARLVSTFPYDGSDGDAVPDDGWQVRAYNVAGSAKRVTPYAICLG